MQNSNNKLLNTKEASQYIGITKGTMQVWRCLRTQNIAFIRVGRLIRYRKSDLDAWLQSRTVGNSESSS